MIERKTILFKIKIIIKFTIKRRILKRALKLTIIPTIIKIQIGFSLRHQVIMT